MFPPLRRYTHPFVTVIQLTAFPTDYPDGVDEQKKPRWDLPTSTNTAPYYKRGWCWTESLWVGWTGRRPLDLACLMEAGAASVTDDNWQPPEGSESRPPIPASAASATANRIRGGAASTTVSAPAAAPSAANEEESEAVAAPTYKIESSHVRNRRTLFRLCESRRTPPAPLTPSEYKAEVVTKAFLNAKEDEPVLIAAYSEAYEAFFSSARRLDYSECGWGEAEVELLCRMLRSGVARRLEYLYLGGNLIHNDGMRAIAEVVNSGAMPLVTAIALDGNPGDASPVLDALERLERYA